MVFGLFEQSSKQETKKLQQERALQEQLIAEHLKALHLEHEYQRQTMTQKGLINQQQLQRQKEEEEEEKKKKKILEEQQAAAAKAKLEQQQQQQQQRLSTSESTSSSSSSTTNNNNNNNNNGNGNSQLPSQKKKSPAAGPITQKWAQHMEMARKGYEQLVHAIVRPPRANYKPGHLGPNHFTFLGRRFLREDVTLLTERGYRIECSHWHAAAAAAAATADGAENTTTAATATTLLESTVVVYMHGNASARVEVLQQLSYLLSLGTSVVSFDFAGSGLSDGDYVSLGYYEREDLATVVAHLRATMGSQVQIALWGRSMGAATALMYASREVHLPIQNVSCLVLDSSFCDLVQLAEEMVDKAREQGIGVPNVVVSVALAAIGWSVQQKAQFDIKDISPIQHAPNIHIPALFVCGEQDDFIKPHHSEKICEHYRGSKNLLLVPGDHNDLRPPILFQAATQFLSKHLLTQKNEDDEDDDDGGGGGRRRRRPRRHLAPLEVPEGLNLQTAPWQHKSNPQICQIHPDLLIHSSSSTTMSMSSSSMVVDTATTTATTTDIGMTKERQQAIQSSLNTMFAGVDQEEAAAAEEETAETTASSTSKDQFLSTTTTMPQGQLEGEEIILKDHHVDGIENEAAKAEDTNTSVVVEEEAS